MLLLLHGHVSTDATALLAQHVCLTLLLLRQLLRVHADGILHALTVALQPLPCTLELLVGVLRLEELAHMILLVACLQRDDLIRAPARLLNLFQRLPLLHPQPLKAVPQQIDIVLRAQTRVLHVEHVRPGERATRFQLRRSGHCGGDRALEDDSLLFSTLWRRKAAEQTPAEASGLERRRLGRFQIVTPPPSTVV